MFSTIILMVTVLMTVNVYITNMTLESMVKVKYHQNLSY